ncbi:MAG: PDZ domain-containing protein [Myxococcales bacterium]|nr:PDZ domain-containing protein [Myxococcales bacterium]
MLLSLAAAWSTLLAQVVAPVPAPTQESVESPTAAAPATDAPAATPSPAAPAVLPAAWSDHLLDEVRWRSLGPVNMGGRISDLAVDPRRPSTFFVAAASGGVWRTDNHGTTFTPVFETGPTASIGDIAIAPSDSAIVWIGTGEANPRNSVIPGAGAWKSIDGGKTFQPVGLADTRHIGRIAIHPTRPDTVFVAAVGHTWGSNAERGLYRTDDGGATWKNVLFVDDQSGCIDVAIDPQEPAIVHAATWQRRRDAFDGGDPVVQTGPGSGIWRSTDGGETFVRSTAGLPTVPLGRVGLDLFAADSRIVFAVVQTELTGRKAPGQTTEEGGPAWLGVRGEASDAGYLVSEALSGGPAASAGILKGDRVARIAAAPIRTFEELRLALDQHLASEECELTLLREGTEITIRVKFGRRPGPAGDFGGEQGGQTANAQSRQGDHGVETGGVFRSDDRGATWQRVNSLNPRPFYYSQIRVDPRDASLLFVLGISLHQSNDGGTTFDAQGARVAHPDHHALWIDPRDSDHLLLGNDGGLYVTWDRGTTWELLDKLPLAQFYGVAVGMDRPYRIAGGLQDNGSWAGPSASLRRGGIPIDAWQYINGGDGFHCAIDPDDPAIVYSESQNGALARMDLSTGTRADIRPPGQRFCWSTPIVISPHNGRTLWCGGEFLCQSVNRGDTWTTVSPDLARTPRGSLSAIAESPLVAEVVACGTDDGALWLTRDGGRTWESLIERLPDLPGPRYVADLLFSQHERETLFVVLDGRRSDDQEPWLFRSRDFGATFVRLRDGLPADNLHALAESPRKRGVLFAGSSRGCHVSLDDGDRFVAFDGNLPTVPLFDLVIHPREPELIAATHGRGIWIADIAAVEQLTHETLAKQVELLVPRTVALAPRLAGSSSYSAPRFQGENPYDGVELWYWLGPGAGDAVDAVVLAVKNVSGTTIATLNGAGGVGLHAVRWNLALDLNVPGMPALRDGRLQPGDYLVSLAAGGETDSAPLRVERDPAFEPRASIGARDF